MENTENKELVAIIQANGIELTEGESIVTSFAYFMAEAKKLVEQSGSVVVADENDKEGMDRARELRLALGRVRIEAEKSRKGFKDGYVKKGRAIDQIAKEVSKIIEPTEESLERLEKTALHAATERKEKALQERYESRVSQIKPFLSDLPDGTGSDVSMIYGLKDMPDGAFDNLLKEYADKRDARLKKEEEERAVAEANKKEAERLEGIRLEQEEKDRVQTEEKRKQEEAAKAEEKRLADERDKFEQEKRDEAARKEAERKAEEERIHLEKEAREKAERDEKERIEKERIERERKERESREAADAEERRKALLPDKEKLALYADTLKSILPPVLETSEARDILIEAQDRISQALEILKK